MNGLLYKRVMTFALYKHSEKIEWRDAYEYHAKGRFPALQRLCFWVLRKLRAFAYIDKTTIQRAELPLDGLVELIMRNRLDVEMIYNRRAKYLIVGADTFNELTHESQLHTPPFLTFPFPYDYDARVGFNHEPMPKLFAGLEVIIVPWVDGLFVLPELKG